MYRRKSLPLLTWRGLLPALREDLLELHCLQVGSDADFAHTPLTPILSIGTAA